MGIRRGVTRGQDCIYCDVQVAHLLSAAHVGVVRKPDVRVRHMDKIDALNDVGRRRGLWHRIGHDKSVVETAVGGAVSIMGKRLNAVTRLEVVRPVEIQTHGSGAKPQLRPGHGDFQVLVLRAIGKTCVGDPPLRAPLLQTRRLGRDTAVDQIVITLPACGRILIGVNEQQHPVGVRLRGERLVRTHVKKNGLVIHSDLAGHDVIASRAVDVARDIAPGRLVTMCHITASVVKCWLHRLPVLETSINVNGIGFCGLW